MAERAALAVVGLLVALAPPSTPDTSQPEICERSAPETTSSTHSSTDLADFERVSATLTEADGTVVELCLLLADTPERQGRGLMEVPDVEALDGADGMVFVWDEPVALRFYMWRTPMPLTVAFFDEAGEWLGGAEMEPCLDATAARCERYSAPAPYAAALEVPAGSLADHLGDGATLNLAALPMPEPTSTG